MLILLEENIYYYL